MPYGPMCSDVFSIPTTCRLQVRVVLLYVQRGWHFYSHYQQENLLLYSNSPLHASTRQAGGRGQLLRRSTCCFHYNSELIAMSSGKNPEPRLPVPRSCMWCHTLLYLYPHLSTSYFSTRGLAPPSPKSSIRFRYLFWIWLPSARACKVTVTQYSNFQRLKMDANRHQNADSNSSISQKHSSNPTKGALNIFSRELYPLQDEELI